MNPQECYKNCPWIARLDFVGDKKLFTFPELFENIVEGIVKRDLEIQQYETFLKKFLEDLSDKEIPRQFLVNRLKHFLGNNSRRRKT